MIYRNKQYIGLRRYGTAFLDAFGFFPLDYFGAIGDNLTDNYANIQVAIDESIKKGYRYIFVPNGIYFYTGNLLNADKIKFIGDAEHAKIYDGENEITIYQIGTQIPYSKGTQLLEKEVTEAGHIDIDVPVKNGSEAILVVDDNVVYVTDTLNLLNGSLYTQNQVSLGTGVYISSVEIIKNAIRINFITNIETGTINKEVEWRVR